MEKLRYGLRNLYYAKITESSEGAITFATPVKIPGARSMSFPPVGDVVKVYADDIVFYQLNINQGYEGDLTTLALPESFITEMLGEEKIGETNVIIENANAVFGKFAFLYEMQTDIAGKTKRGILYYCTASRPDVAGSTKKETTDPAETVITITASPLPDTMDIKASVVGDKTDANWLNWFDAVVTRASLTPAP